MQWKGKGSGKVGDYNQRIRFAFLPTKLSDESWIWLETYIDHGVWTGYAGSQRKCTWTLLRRELP